jgi:GH25 family lysozyme M1 (1,4-beta-N-acetylmuramidase)
VTDTPEPTPVDATPSTPAAIYDYRDADGVTYAVRNDGKWMAALDVSHHQNPDRVDLEGCELLIIRAAYGLKPDKAFKAFFKRAEELVPLIGAYCFFRQTQPAVSQFESFRWAIDGAPINVLPTVDFETNKLNGDGVPTRGKFSTDGRQLFELCQKHWGCAMLYTSPGFYQSYLRADWCRNAPKWLAHATGKPGKLDTLKVPELEHWVGHQYSFKGKLGEPLDRSVFRGVPMLGAPNV